MITGELKSKVDRIPHGPHMISPDDVLDGLILTLDLVRAHALPKATVV